MANPSLESIQQHVSQLEHDLRNARTHASMNKWLREHVKNLRLRIEILEKENQRLARTLAWYEAQFERAKQNSFNRESVMKSEFGSVGYVVRVLVIAIVCFGLIKIGNGSYSNPWAVLGGVLFPIFMIPAALKGMWPWEVLAARKQEQVK